MWPAHNFPSGALVVVVVMTTDRVSLSNKTFNVPMASRSTTPRSHTEVLRKEKPFTS